MKLSWVSIECIIFVLLFITGLQIENQKLKTQSNDTKNLENIKQQNEKLNEELTEMKQENVRLQADQKEAFDELNLLEKDVFALVQARVCL